MKNFKGTTMIWTSVLHELVQNACLLKVGNEMFLTKLMFGLFASVFWGDSRHLGEDCILTGPGLILPFFHRFFSLYWITFICKHLLCIYCAQDFISFKLLVQSSLFKTSCLFWTCDLKNWMIKVLCFILSSFADILKSLIWFVLFYSIFYLWLTFLK